MAFGINKLELMNWKRKVGKGEIAFLTHYWLDHRFPSYTSVTKVGSCNLETLILWGRQYNLQSNWIHQSRYPHYDLFGERQKHILLQEGLYDHIKRFNL